MKLLCIGKSGQVARALDERGAVRNLEIICLGRPDIDLSKRETLHAAIEKTRPNVVINAGAYTNVDGAETNRETAFEINATGAGHLANACATHSKPLIHISTDYVFNASTDRPLREIDITDGANAYGASKLAGEVAVRAALTEHLILRISWIYSPFGSNFVKTMLRLANTLGSASVVDDQIGSPTSALDIADAILDISQQISLATEPNKYGTYHFAAAGFASWADVAAFIFELFEDKTGCKIALNRIPSSDYPTPAARPLNSRLDTQKISEAFGIVPANWKFGVRQAVDRLLAEEGNVS